MLNNIAIMADIHSLLLCADMDIYLDYIASVLMSGGSSDCYFVPMDIYLGYIASVLMSGGSSDCHFVLLE